MKWRKAMATIEMQIVKNKAPKSGLTVEIIMDGPPMCGKSHFQRRIMAFVESIKDEYPGMRVASHSLQETRTLDGDAKKSTLNNAAESIRKIADDIESAFRAT